MEEYIFALIAFVLLLPVLLFLPGAMTRKGKVWIAGGGLLISLLGLLASNQYPLGLVAIILFILVIVSSVMIGNRFGPLLLAEEGMQDRNNSAEADTAAERPEKILFTAVEEDPGSAESTLVEQEDVQEAQAESETRVEFINEDLEEIPLLTENSSSVYDIKEEADAPEIEEDAAQDSEDKEDGILEEVSFLPSHDENLSEIEMLISQEEGELAEPIHNKNHDEAAMEAEEPLDELKLNDTVEEWNSVDVEEDDEELSEIELLIELSDESEPAVDESELLGTDFELSIDAEAEVQVSEESEVTAKEHDLGELTDIEAQFLMSSPSEDEHELEVLSPIEESIVEIEEPEEPVLAEDLLEIEGPEDKIRSDQNEILVSGESAEVAEEQEEELQPVLLSDLTDDAEMMILSADSHQENADESIEEETQQEQEPQGNAQLQTLIIHTIAEELAYYRNKMSLEEFEALAAQYMQPELHDRDFYVLSQQLIQRYHESQEFKKMKVFIEGMEERFMTYPLLKSELNDYKEMAWKNIIKQELLNRRE
ncbi:hypothetical protein FZC78_01000 [Rossellomorea vietnamensis]|uniref:Uncharacterized protein n=1 Tax=Rossellomorea vietnamensis TaxID=218284 RepID=A0A5D4NZ69_9BACI|nr:hypothetical protein [Rossellomorea vietnamensis]TYS19637.1 hypothetical protein FZC78_01000 [Rossellomorea vietnamensis]